MVWPCQHRHESRRVPPRLLVLPVVPRRYKIEPKKCCEGLQICDGYKYNYSDRPIHRRPHDAHFKPARQSARWQGRRNRLGRRKKTEN